MSESFTIAAYVCFLFSGILFVVSLAIFFGQNIPRVIRELNGKLAKEEIEQLRIRSEQAAANQSKGVLDYTENQRLTTERVQNIEKIAPSRTSNNSPPANIGAYRSGGTSVLNIDASNKAFEVYKSEVVINTDEYIK
ncbi:MAG: hypothetical protein IJ491_00500 [Clostridia bacterium]|nr:hypothetical protein [Clostridia bacterium]